MPCGVWSGRRASSAWRGPSSWEISPSRETSSSSWRRSTPLLPTASMWALACPGRPSKRPAASASSVVRSRRPRKRRRPADGCAHPGPRRPSGAASLRRQQRLLRHGPRACHDVLLRTLSRPEWTRSKRLRRRSTTLCVASSDWPTDPGNASSTSVVAGAASPSTLPGSTAPRWWVSPSARRRRGWHVSESAARAWRAKSRFDCRTTGMCVTGHSTASPRSGCSSTSVPRRAPSTSPPCADCSGRRADSSITPSRASADRASARARSSVVMYSRR